MLGVGLSVAAPVDAQQPPAGRTLSIATLAPAGSTWMRVFEAWNREIRRRTNNGLSLRFYPGGVQGDEAEVIRKVRTGRLDGGAVTAVGLAQIHRPALVFQMPGMFSGYGQLDNARNALNGELAGQFQTAGFQLLGWADVGRSRVFSNSPIATPSALQGKHPWAWSDDAVLPAFFTAAGVTGTVSLQVPEVLGAMQTGRVDTVITSPVACVALQWSTRVSTMTDMPISVIVGATVIGQTQWASLPPDQQTVLTETAAQFHALARRNLRADENTALAGFAQRNITTVPVDAAGQAAWNTVFSNTRTALTGHVADAAFIQRVHQAAH